MEANEDEERGRDPVVQRTVGEGLVVLFISKSLSQDADRPDLTEKRKENGGENE